MGRLSVQTLQVGTIDFPVPHLLHKLGKRPIRVFRSLLLKPNHIGFPNIGYTTSMNQNLIDLETHDGHDE
jgi:hypothetical protein